MILAQSLFSTDLNTGMNHLYNFDFKSAHQTFDQHIVAHSGDSLGHALKAATYMFQEFDRLQILESEFFEDDKRVVAKKKLQYDPVIRDRFYEQINLARSLAEEALKKNPNDQNALFAASTSAGLLTDYTCLVEKRNLTSLSYAKEAQTYAVRLLALNPHFGDAYLTTGFTEYLLGSLPFFMRWFIRFDDTQGNKMAAIEKLHRAADAGHYLKPFAKILLSIVYLREKQPLRTQKLLQGLTLDYPHNPLLRKELAKVNEHIASAKN